MLSMASAVIAGLLESRETLFLLSPHQRKQRSCEALVMEQNISFTLWERKHGNKQHGDLYFIIVSRNSQAFGKNQEHLSGQPGLKTLQHFPLQQRAHCQALLSSKTGPAVDAVIRKCKVVLSLENLGCR